MVYAFSNRKFLHFAHRIVLTTNCYLFLSSGAKDSRHLLSSVSQKELISVTGQLL